MLLEKVDGVAHVTRAWEGATVLCVASGPSLTPDQLTRARRVAQHTIVVNDCYLLAPWADVLYWADLKWHKWHAARPEFLAFAGQRCTILNGTQTGDAPGVFALRNGGGEGLSTDPKAIKTGSNSGYQAINIATLSGAKRVILLGYDCKRTGSAMHFFGNHPDGTEPPYALMQTRYKTMPPELEKLGVEVVNCTPGSALTMFRTAALEDLT